MAKQQRSYKMRGFKRKSFEEYFKQIGGMETLEGVFESEGWKAVLGQETYISIGSIKLPQVDVVITCEDDIFGKFTEEYKLRFLTAGG